MYCNVVLKCCIDNDEKTNALVAFGFPPKEEFSRQYDWLKNGFTFVSWPIPVEYEKFVTRVLRSQENGKIKKESLEAPLAMISTNFACRLGLDGIIEDGTTGAFQRHSCVFSNVPGFSQDIYFQKSRVVRMEGTYFNVIPQFILMSYKEKIFVTLACDPKRFPNAQIIVDHMVQECDKEYEKLMSSTQPK